jgi:hypothetical protein
LTNLGSTFKPVKDLRHFFRYFGAVFVQIWQAASNPSLTGIAAALTTSKESSVKGNL